jgi:2-amino-4-hydroxy-6-hydroxymethyldihydropteridine diphosphokinase
MRRRAVLALGSNLGDRFATLQGAVTALLDAPGIDAVAASPVYETDPVGGPDQPDFLNAVLVVDTSLSADLLLARAKATEDAFDRTREVEWGPRTLDVDVIAVGDETSDAPELTLPHPRAHERAFVLAPWHDVDADAEIPGQGRVADLLAASGGAGVHRRDDLELRLPE